jgi:hypothetical protein
MPDFEEMAESVKHYYIKAYGEYTPGEYYLGSEIAFPSTTGTVLWSYRQFGNGPLTYVVQTGGDDMPVKVLASDVVSR